MIYLPVVIAILRVLPDGARPLEAKRFIRSER